jgi:hypothetical protein
MDMSDSLIIRGNIRENFSVLPNDLMNDERLSADALGVLVYLLSKPTDWQVRVTELRRRFDIGRDKVYRILGSMEQYGYLVRESVKTEGQFAGTRYIVSDSPRPEKPDTVLPDTANQDYIKNRDTINLYKQRTDSNGWFEKFWNVVAHKTAKADCKRKFEKAAKTVEPETIIKAYQAQLAAHKSKGKDAEYFRRPLTWLNQQGWEDETPVADGPIRRVKLPDSEADYQKIPIQLVLNKPELREYAKAKGWYRADSPFDNQKEKHG